MRPFTRADAIAFDRHASEVLGVPGAVLMENAAIGCVPFARELAASRWPAARVEIVCGSGNNGGDGYALARQLLVAGALPRVRMLGEPRAGSDAAWNARSCAALGVPTVPIDSPFEGALLVDAIFGTGLDRPVSAGAARVIGAINAFRDSGRPVLSIDLPSGLDTDTGEPLGAAVRATVTATMVAPKKGFSNPAAARYVGRVEVVPIGVPAP